MVQECFPLSFALQSALGMPLRMRGQAKSILCRHSPVRSASSCPSDRVHLLRCNEWAFYRTGRFHVLVKTLLQSVAKSGRRPRVHMLCCALFLLVSISPVVGQTVPQAHQDLPAAIRPFKMQVPDSVLADLHRRLAETKWPDQLPGTTWEYGADIKRVRELRTTGRRNSTGERKRHASTNSTSSRRRAADLLYPPAFVSPERYTSDVDSRLARIDC